MQATYISSTETAKLIRAALKRSFPRTKFGVRSRSYSGGSSIDFPDYAPSSAKSTAASAC